MFDNQYEVVVADTLESKIIHYSIRYQVYCEEMGFENGCNFPFKQEFDVYDDHAVHFIVRHKPTEQWIGAMRLIFKTDHLLPIEQHCTLNKRIDKIDLSQSVELSRLCLINKVRKKFNDTNLPKEVFVDQKEIKETDKVRLIKNCRINRSIIWGLIYAASKYSYQNNIRDWYFMTTRGLEKVLRNGGLDILKIGNPCNYKGQRYPFRMNAFETYRSEIWRDDFKNGYHLFSELELIEKHKAA